MTPTTLDMHSLLRLRYDEIFRSEPGMLKRNNGDTVWIQQKPCDKITDMISQELKESASWVLDNKPKSSNGVWIICVTKQLKHTIENLKAEREQDVKVAERVLVERDLKSQDTVKRIRNALGLDVIQNFENGPLGGTEPADTANRVEDVSKGDDTIMEDTTIDPDKEGQGDGETKGSARNTQEEEGETEGEGEGEGEEEGEEEEEEDDDKDDKEVGEDRDEEGERDGHKGDEETDEDNEEETEGPIKIKKEPGVKKSPDVLFVSRPDHKRSTGVLTPRLKRKAEGDAVSRLSLFRCTELLIIQ